MWNMNLWPKYLPARLFSFVLCVTTSNVYGAIEYGIDFLSHVKFSINVLIFSFFFFDKKQIYLKKNIYPKIE